MVKKLIQGSAAPTWLVRWDGEPVDTDDPLPVEFPTAMPVEAEPWDQPDDQYHAPAADTAAVVTLTGVAGQQWNIAGIYWSYSEAPTGGGLTITDGGTTKFQIDVPDAGAGFLPFPPMRFTAGWTVVVTLAAGAGTCEGKLNVVARIA